MKLVIVDDDIALLNALSRRFSQRGFAVIAIAEPVSTEQLVNENADTYLLDLRFASQSGLNFVAPLRQALPKCRIVLLTGYASIANAVQAVKLGADDYLTKPADLLQLEQAVNIWLLRALRKTHPPCYHQTNWNGNILTVYWPSKKATSAALLSYWACTGAPCSAS